MFEREIQATILGVDGDVITIRDPGGSPVAMNAGNQAVVLQAAAAVSHGGVCRITVTNGQITKIVHP